ncbi:substrate-binding periplasmic protein [Burkholderiaceae bacterium UC74_6]
MSRRTDFAWLFCLVLGSAPVWAQTPPTEVISLPWTERRPFQFIDGQGKLKGILVDLGEEIFTKAGVPKKWVETPAGRIAQSLLTDKEPLCLVGWFRTPEREKIAKISLPIHRDRRQLAVVRADSPISGERGLRALMGDKHFTLLVKAGYSYGAYLDSLIAARKDEKGEKSEPGEKGERADKVARIESVVGDHARMLAMIHLGRADLMFLTPEEVDYYAAENPRFTNEFKVIAFKEIPAGNLRHILCSKQVSDETMSRLDAAIRSSIKIKTD